MKWSVISLLRVLGTNNPSLQVENKEPVCSVILCDQKGWWQVGQTGQAAAPPYSPARLGFTVVPSKASGRRAGTAVAFLLPWFYTRSMRVGEHNGHIG